MDCNDVSSDNFKVSGSDPHNFDRDGNGVGCQSDTGEKPRHQNPRKNPDCYYYGKYICDDKSGNCDDEHFDCVSDCEDGTTQTTGMCPGDDDDKCVDDNEYICGTGGDTQSKDKKKSGGSNSNDNDSNNPTLKDIKKIFDSNVNSESVAKKFEVKVILDNVTIAESDAFRMRVIIYGPHTLNKPTLDKPGQLVNVQGCGSSCYTDWGFTASKVPIGSEIQACVWNPETGHENCAHGESSSEYGPEIIRVDLPIMNLNTTIS